MKKIYSAIILSLAILSSKAQVSGYSFTQFSSTYAAITGGTVFGSTTSDDQRFVNASIPLGGTALVGPGINIGFNFTFNGNVYDRLAINNNGWISLGQSTLAPNPVNMNSSDYYSSILATSTAPAVLQNRIGGLSRDLQGQTGSEIRVETIGVTPNQTCVVQWTNYRKWNATGDNFNFQIRLTETSNKVDVIYGTFTTTASGTAQVGLRGASNADFNDRDVSVSNPWATSIAGTANTSIVNFNNTLTPATGQNYQWAPPVLCSGTPNSGVAAISSSTGCPNSNFNLNGTGLTTALGITYQWYSAPAASGPWSAINTATNTSLITSTNTVTFYQIVTTCSASALSATSSAISYTPVGPCYTMANTTITTCSGSLFDSGGQSADYLNNESYTLTLVPSTANAMAALNFVSFNTESGWDYLYIYDGNSTSSPLIGQYSGSTLPPAITATNNTGILTLRFTSDGSTALAGFEAAISCFIPPTCSGVPNSGIAAISSASGCPNTNFSLTTSGLSTGLGISYQWYSAPAASGPWSAITTATNTSLITNTNTITFYQLETTCSVSAMSATTSVVSYTPVGPCYTMANTTITTCSGSLFDSGGQSADYLNNESYTLTLVPSTANAMAVLNFISFNTESGWDYLYIYDGNSTSSPLVGQYSGTTLPPAVTATNNTGILTLRFTSDGSNVAPGFEAAISCFIPPNCSGVPNSGTAAISSASGCPNVPFNLSATGTSTGLGISYQWYSAPAASGPWSAISTATNTSYSTSTSVTTYYQMQTTCTISAMSATTSLVSYSVVNPGPCVCAGYTTSSATSSADEDIVNVIFHTLNNTSTCTSVGPGPGSVQNLYSNYVGFLAAPSVTQAQTVSFTVQVGTCGGSFSNCTSVYIDYNQNGLFTDAGEQAYLSSSATFGPHLETGNITIPLSATPGTTRMRVITVETSNPAVITPTGTYNWGETEDYCVDIALANLCAGTPNSGTASISSPSACPNSTLNLTATGLSAALGIQYQWFSAPAASGPWTAITSATNTSYSVSTPTTTYYMLQTTCTVSALTATTSIVSFSVVNPGPCVCNNYGISGATSTSDEDIWNVSFGSLNNTSNCTVVAPGPGSILNRYGNYSGFIAAPTVMQGQNVSYGVNINTCGGWWGMEFDVYIDFNQNGLFTDAGELVVNNTSAIQGNNTGLIAIPLTASVGVTRMRIVASEGTVPGPTGTFPWGETEDYCIDIIAPIPCSGTPNSGTASISSNTGCISDIFNLNASGLSIGTGITFQWYSGPSASGPWSAITTATNTAFANSASVTTFYQMVTTCSNSALSATTTVVSYTPSNCYTMSNNTIVACGGTIYDSGGLNNDYTSNEDFTLTVVPSVANSSVILTFNTFLTEAGFDYLDIHDGYSTSDPLLGSYDGNTLPPVTVATNTAGVLTLHFYSDGSFEDAGFDISVTCTSSCSGPPPAPAITTMSICSGNSATLTAAATGTAQWYTTSTASNTPISTNTLFATPVLTANTTYYVRDTTICGASSLVPVAIIVATTPTMNVTSTNSAICIGQSATLTATSMTTYSWSTNATTSVIIVTPTTTTNYTVTGTELLCNTTQTGAVSVGVNALPSVSMTASGVSTICASNGSISLTGSPSGGVFSGPAVIGSQLSIANPGTFVPMYSYTNSLTGCSNSATTQVIVINCGSPSGLVSIVSTSGFNIYPNPNTGSFLVETNNKTIKNVNVCDMTGRTVYTTVSEESNIQVNITDLANGIYYVKVSTKESTHVIKVIKQ